MVKQKKIIVCICGWILFALMVIVIICTLLPTKSRVSLSSHAMTERIIIPHLSEACEAYRKEYTTYPSYLENFCLVKTLTGDNPRQITFTDFNKHWINSHGEIIDGWGTPLKIEKSFDKLLITSAGSDKIFGTKDDITGK